ncbi:MAG TPA: GNAT family N-acetyltransferase [Chloroflexia bacterium]|jgi:ribosomal protein S18 acetylase RimI-like enzyme|nr:GNAT family N-acetyltransferase [Chloroflexia bacterium]
MTSILQDTAPAALTAAIEDNLFAFFALFRRLPGAEYEDRPDRIRLLTGIPFPMFNAVFRARLAPDGLEAGITATLAPFAARHLPMLWWTGPATRPADLGARLLARGMVRTSDSTGMACDLRDLPPPGVPPGLTIARVRDAAGFAAWMGPVARSFDLPPFAAAALRGFCEQVGFGPDAPFQHYLARVAGTPVAGASLFLGAGVAGLYNVATAPDARGQGTATALVLAALHAARARGYRVGILQSTRMGLNLYHRLGFAEYSTIAHYLGPPVLDPAR